MSYYQYKDSGRSLGKILYQLNDQLRVPNHIVSEVMMQANGYLSYQGMPFASYFWDEDDTPIFSFVEQYKIFFYHQENKTGCDHDKN